MQVFVLGYSNTSIYITISPCSLFILLTDSAVIELIYYSFKYLPPQTFAAKLTPKCACKKYIFWQIHQVWGPN